MSNKFLGINSLNVLKKYIDDQILLNEENARLMTLHVYKYAANDSDRPTKPNGGAFNPETAQITYPETWLPLHKVIENLGTEDEAYTKLTNGAIWMSVGVAEGNSLFGNWSLPIKITGMNGLNGKDGVDGITVEFRWTYDDTLTEDDIDSMEVTPLSPNSANRKVYVWSKYTAEEVWHKSLWAIYAVDATNVVWRYCVSKDIDDNNCPVDPSPWSLDLPTLAIDEEYPYMWMSYKIIPARPIDQLEDEPNSTTGWTSPVLFGRFGKDGADGITPDYNVTLYKLGDGFAAPNCPELGESNTLEDFMIANSDWLTLPVKSEPLEPIEPLEPLIDNSKYVNTETELIENLVSGEKIVLNEDIALTKALVITTDITIDLNGHTITGGLFTESNGKMLEGNTDSYVFWVKDGGNLTICDNAGTGKAIAQPADYSMAVWCQGGNVTIEGGEFHNGGESCTLIYGSGTGNIVIKGGKFIATPKGTQPGTGDEYTALNIKDRDNMTCSIIVEGGYYYGFDPAHNSAEDNADWWEANPNGFVADGHESIQDGDWYIVKPIQVEETIIWWQCTINVNGMTNEVNGIGDVCRYNAVDGNAKPGQYTKYEFCWSTDQNVPALPDWTTSPVYDSKNQEGSLWMHFADVIMNTNTGELEFLSDWSEPIKLTGPRGPIAHDYRLETRYNIGTATKPKSLPNETIWSKNTPSTTTQYPYVWAKNYLVLYKMKYDDLGDVVVDDSKGITVIEEYDHFRLSGLNGEDGNKKNSISYSNSASTLDVTSFAESNLYISNASENTIYNIKLDTLSFIDGYTGKFANIGTGLVTIDAGRFKFVGSCKEATTIELNPQESVELICYNNGDIKELIVIGKAL